MIEMNTSYGEVDLAHLEAEDFRAYRLAPVLGRIPRFNGHRGHHMADRHYSVAEHSLHVAALSVEIADEKGFKTEFERDMIRMAALMHDAHEVYMGDVTRPVRRLIRDKGIANWELDQLNQLVKLYCRGWVRVPSDAWRVVSRMDTLACEAEQEYLFNLDCNLNELPPAMQFGMYENVDAKTIGDIWFQTVQQLGYKLGVNESLLVEEVLETAGK